MTSIAIAAHQSENVRAPFFQTRQKTRATWLRECQDKYTDVNTEDLSHIYYKKVSRI